MICSCRGEEGQVSSKSSRSLRLNSRLSCESFWEKDGSSPPGMSESVKLRYASVFTASAFSEAESLSSI